MIHDQILSFYLYLRIKRPYFLAEFKISFKVNMRYDALSLWKSGRVAGPVLYIYTMSRARDY